MKLLGIIYRKIEDEFSYYVINKPKLWSLIYNTRDNDTIKNNQGSNSHIIQGEHRRFDRGLSSWQYDSIIEKNQWTFPLWYKPHTAMNTIYFGQSPPTNMRREIIIFLGCDPTHGSFKYVSWDYWPHIVRARPKYYIYIREKICINTVQHRLYKYYNEATQTYTVIIQ